MKSRLFLNGEILPNNSISSLNILASHNIILGNTGGGEWVCYMKSDLGFLDEIEVELEQLASTLHYYRFFTTTTPPFTMVRFSANLG